MMPPRLRPNANVFAAFARGSSIERKRASCDAERRLESDGARDAGGAVTPVALADGALRYDRATMLAMRAREDAKVLPVELSSSTIECVINETNGALAARAGAEEAEKGSVTEPGAGAEVGGGVTPSVSVTASNASVVVASTGPMDVEKSKRFASKSLANKLTMDKVDKMLAALRDCAMSDLSVAKALTTALVDRVAADDRAAAAVAEFASRARELAPAAYLINNGASSVTYKSLLLSALQDDFEQIEVAREGLSACADRFERDALAKKLKTRVVGVVKLIGELYVRRFIGEGVVRAVADELIGENGSIPREDDVEALCALLTIVGAPFDGKLKKVVDAYVARLNVWAESEDLNAKTRFVCRDVIDLRGAAWKSAIKSSASTKSSDDVLANASPVVSSEILFPEGPRSAKPSLAPLRGPYDAPAVVRSFPTAQNRAALEAELRRDAKARAEERAAAAAAAAAGAVASTSNYTAEQAAQKIASFVDEFCVAGDVSEALLCVADLVERTADGEATKNDVARALVDRVVNESTVKTAELVGDLLAALFNRGEFATSALEQAIGDTVAYLDDISIDVPMAPKLMAKVVARIVGASAVALDFITAAGSGIEDASIRREFCGEALVELRARGFPGLVKGALQLDEFAATDEDGVDTVTEWLQKLNLADLA